MASFEMEAPPHHPKTADEDEWSDSPVEQVRLTVPNDDDPTLPVWTFRMWFLGLLSCVLLSFLNTFFSYRTEPLSITMISVQVATLPIGRFMAAVLPKRKFKLFGLWEFTLNPGPFNMKEHVLISIFANAGSGTAYAVGIVNIIKAIYRRKISFVAIAYWGLNLYSAKTFPIFSSHLFNRNGGTYDVSSIVNDKFEIDLPAYEKQGRINLSVFFALTYGLNFAAVMATLTHVAFFNGKEIWGRFRASYKSKTDIHTRLMRKYEDIPGWWFYGMLAITLVVSLALCIFMRKEVQLPWWGLLFAAALALAFTLPISVITATTNQTPGLNVITEYIMGVIYPGRPIANVCFKTYGYISMSQAIGFLNDFKLGHYMKIPPRSMFIVQLVGTIIAGSINVCVAWYLLTSVANICQDQLLPANSPWTCPSDRVFYDASVIWGLVGPKRIFGVLGNYGALNWCFLIGALGPVVVWGFHKLFPSQGWIKLINIPVLLGATAMMPPASSVNYNSWIVVGTIFNLFVYRYRKGWWQRYNYVLSAALDAGLAFMGVLLYFSLGMEEKGVSWWGSAGEHCDLAACPTARGVAVDGCPVF
ncbi:oligopeptide transporter [Striga asiatica]|uniref:Oligopeptide transporter n=1 Tax=Striga asiatica TaxID=4170 RepID=A0A5A7R778_STRAF|nr:oligopeptide transporter [Striga asiatica]